MSEGYTIDNLADGTMVEVCICCFYTILIDKYCHPSYALLSMKAETDMMLQQRKRFETNNNLRKMWRSVYKLVTKMVEKDL